MTPPTTHADRRSRHRAGRGRAALTAVGVVLGGLVVLGSPAAAAQPDARVSDAEARWSETDRPIEALHLGCEARVSDEVAGVHCRWSAPTSDAAAGLRLWRVTVGADAGRQVVFRTDDVSVTSYTDVPVRPGHRYVYVIQAVNTAGRTVGASRGAPVAVPPLPDVRPDVEVLRLECRPATGFHVGCSWTAPTVPGARTLTLWRSVDGGARTRVVSSHHPFPTAYRDSVPAGTHRAVYAVIATDGDGRIVARSRAESVAFLDAPPTDVPPTDMAPTDVPPTDVVPSDVVPSDVVPSDVVPPDTRPPDTRPPDTRPPDVRPPDVRPPDVRPPDVRPPDVRPPNDVRPDRGDDRQEGAD